MVLIIRMDRAELIAYARARQVGACVGPTSPDAWTAARPEGGRWFDTADLARLGLGFVDVGDTDDLVGIYLQVGDGARAQRIVWPEEDLPAGPVAEAAATLAQLFGRPERAGEVETVLRRRYDWDEDLTDALAAVLDLPPLDDAPPPQAVVVFKGPPDVAWMAARVAGPAAVDDGVDGWTTLLPTAAVDDDSPAFPLAAGLSAARKRAPVLLFWRDGEQCGVLVWRRGRVSDAHGWNQTWLSTLDEPVEAEALITATRPAAPDRVRAVVGRNPTGGEAVPDPLPELVNLLGLPATVLTALDRPDSFRGGAAQFERTGLGKAFVDEMREARTSSILTIPRPLRIGYAVVTGLAAVIFALMTALAVAVLATGGDVVDQDGTSISDWGWLGSFAALTVVLTFIARARWRAASR